MGPTKKREEIERRQYATGDIQNLQIFVFIL